MKPAGRTTAQLRKFSRFLLIGGAGFLVDAGLLLMMIGAGIGPYAGRAISIVFAVLVTWRLNRALTFGASKDGQMREAARYGSVATSVAMLNYAIYTGLLLLVPACPPLLATALATGSCVLVSFTGYSAFVFRRA